MKRRIYLAALLGFAVSLTSCKKELAMNEPGALVPVTVEEDKNLPSINVNGTRLHSEAFGNPSDPMVVFLHGGPGCDYRSGLNVKALVANKYYVVFYDQRGAGLSQRHPKDSYSLQLMLDDLSAVITHYRSSPIQKVFLFGHSWGAMLTAAYLNKYPAAVQGAVLAEPGGFTWNEAKEYSERIRKFKLWDEALNDVMYAEQFLSGKSNEHAVIDYKMALASASGFAPGNPEGIEGCAPFWRYGAAVSKKFFEIGKKDGFDFRSNLKAFAPKTLFLYSQNNTAYGEAYAKKLASAFSNVQLNMIAGTGHEMIHYKWETVYGVVLPYLEALR